MTGEQIALLQELKDRQEIYDCVIRYCRGMDRFDREMLRSAYHADALDDHGTYVGGVEGFINHFFQFHSTYQHRTQHHITNHRCEIDGNIAHTESYYLFRSLNKDPPLYAMASGRYIDRFEKRGGRWAIADRVCLVDIVCNEWAPTGSEGSEVYLPSARDTSDPSYARPLEVDRRRITS
jgi:SnoaL-like domain